MLTPSEVGLVTRIWDALVCWFSRPRAEPEPQPPTPAQSIDIRRSQAANAAAHRASRQVDTDEARRRATRTVGEKEQ